MRYRGDIGVAWDIASHEAIWDPHDQGEDGLRGEWQIPDGYVRYATTSDLGPAGHRVARLFAAAPKLYEAADILQANAVTAPDPRMAGATDCYLVTLDDMEALRAALASARGEAPHA